eukprot:750577-Hanusia_phi.AAC.1
MHLQYTCCHECSLPPYMNPNRKSPVKAGGKPSAHALDEAHLRTAAGLHGAAVDRDVPLLTGVDVLLRVPGRGVAEGGRRVAPGQVQGQAEDDVKKLV